jgi:hypothetical protein
MLGRASHGTGGGVVPKRVKNASVAAPVEWYDPDHHARAPAGEVHGWVPGTNQTVCGLALAREGLLRFPHVTWADVQPATGGYADRVTGLCRKCAAGLGARRGEKPWVRRDPRP